MNLLKEVARARNRIHSGEVEFDVEQNLDPVKGTRQVNVKMRFDGLNRRSETFAREYSYTQAANDDTNAQASAERMSYEQAVQAGLLRPFESHHVSAYDGALLLDYWENDGKPFQAKIEDPAKGSVANLFDTRCLGLSVYQQVTDTLESCLSYGEAASVRLVGEESVGGIPAWHVQIRDATTKDFWLEKAHPTRVLKHSFNGSTVVSKYDDSNLSDPIPIEIRVTILHGTSGGKTAMSDTVYERRAARFNIAVDPSSFTLAGLNMQIGTEVIDYRLSRRIGYWDGSGLSDLWLKPGAKPLPGPDRTKLMALLSNQPFLPEALDPAQWIMFNSPDGPDLEQAAQVIMDYHLWNTNLVRLCRELERLRPHCSRSMLEALVERNPSIEVRGNACFSLAELRQTEAKYGADPKATAEAVGLYRRVVDEFGNVRVNGTTLAELAKPQLNDLLRLSIGKPVPEMEGEDLEGRPLRLGDFHGKTVLLSFWCECGGCRPDVPNMRKLLEEFKGKPFAIVGVYCDKDHARGKAIAEEMGMLWPSFRDDRSGPLSTLWNNNAWPAFELIDPQGTIHYRDLNQYNVVLTVETFMKD